MNGIAEIQFDMEGDPYFMVEGIVHYLNEFCKDMFSPSEWAYKSLSNTASMGITIDEVGEEVTYQYFTM